jgi:hypothetical protein
MNYNMDERDEESEQKLIKQEEAEQASEAESERSESDRVEVPTQPASYQQEYEQAELKRQQEAVSSNERWIRLGYSANVTSRHSGKDAKRRATVVERCLLPRPVSKPLRRPPSRSNSGFPRRRSTLLSPAGRPMKSRATKTRPRWRKRTRCPTSSLI